MFDWIGMAGNYESRCVDRAEFDWGYISTARVADGEKPYETAVRSDEYGKADDPSDTDGMIIVEAYGSPEEAQAGHTRWVETMTKNPPSELVDCCNAVVAGLLEALSEAPREIRVAK